MAATHPVLAPPAGLTSAASHVAHDRWVPTKESNDYLDHFEERRIKNQVPMPVPPITSAYSNQDIDFSSPTNRAILACNGLPRNFKAGSRCVNPLEPRYVLPGCSPSPSAPGTAQPSPKAGTPVSETPRSVSPAARRPGERLLVSAMSLPRIGDGQGTLASPRLQPLPHSPPAHNNTATAFGGQPQPQPSALASNAALNVNGAVGGLLLYGPTTFAGPAATAIAATIANRNLDVTDINRQHRSASVPPRRNGGFDPLSISDIVPPRKQSPTRPLACLTTNDIKGAGPRARTRDVPSPGHGTLNSADIPGASPACLARPSPTSYALGRWPAPAVPQYHFAHSTRVTMLKKPVTVGE
ncbi:hypothetical protein Vafri_613 [Volvox africanus]|nr:hypothetical protein Vafri_613 [Volvox africanus]